MQWIAAFLQTVVLIRLTISEKTLFTDRRRTDVSFFFFVMADDRATTLGLLTVKHQGIASRLIDAFSF